jgi:lipid A 3-O-deacylase
LTRTRSILLFLLVAVAMIARSETPSAVSSDHKLADSRPVAPDPSYHRWEYGPFVNWGTGVGDRANYKFVWAGAQLGRSLFAPVHAGVLSGQFELGGNIIPFWQAYTPAPHIQTFYNQGPGCPAGGCVTTAPVGGGTFTGVSLTPVILRWNFLNHSERFKPWFQGAGGLIYTTHKFPPSQLLPRLGTSVWNFAPQGGFGFHYFLRPNRSLDLGVNAVHISSASLGDHNPGVNASIQIQVGYTYWK